MCLRESVPVDMRRQFSARLGREHNKYPPQVKALGRPMPVAAHVLAHRTREGRALFVPEVLPLFTRLEHEQRNRVLLALDEGDPAVSALVRERVEHLRGHPGRWLDARQRLADGPGRGGVAVCGRTEWKLVRFAPVQRGGGTLGDVGLHRALHAAAHAGRVRVRRVREVEKQDDRDERYGHEWPAATEDVQWPEEDVA